MLYSVCELIEHYQQKEIQAISRPEVAEVFNNFEHQTEEREYARRISVAGNAHAHA